MSIEADGQEFKVRVSAESIGEDLDSRAILGMTSEDTNVIVVDGTLPRTRREEVMLHELLHIADNTLPEFMVRSLGTRLYGILSNNNILRSNWMGRISDGLPTKAEMERVQAVNQEILDAPEPMFLRTTEGVTGDPVPVTTTRKTRVSEGPWYGDPLEDDHLNVRELDGTINRVAVHRAATYLIAGAGHSPPLERQRYTREVIRLFREELETTPPEALTRLVRVL